MSKSFLINIIKTLFFNITGLIILYKSICYAAEHDDTSFWICAALCILVAISICFIRVDYFKHTDKEIAEASIALFLYALKRMEGTIEEDGHAENLLKDSPLGEAVKEFVDTTTELTNIKENNK